ncbi:malate dehydrogenase [Candidatus Saganbacteria bacterium]|nr:malate dehydrogenase [Candidatus Saganbacteria bacterium]
MPKITVVGAGNVGGQCVYRLAQKGFKDIVLIDVVEGLPQGKALDMMQAGSVDGFTANIKGTNDYKDTKGSDVVVITAGLARKPGMSRDDLIAKNAEILASIVKPLKENSPNAILIIVTNPLDAMTYYALKLSGFKPNRVIGMAPVLDGARMKLFIAEALHADLKDVYAEVMGSHGDLMVPIPRLSTVDGKSLTEVLTPEQINAIVQRTRDGGAEIVKLLKTGSAYYAPGSSAAEMTEAIVKDSKKVLGVCAYLNDEYGINDVYLGVPAKLGKNGIEEIVKLDLTADELSQLQTSAKAVKKLCNKLPV